MITSFNSGPFQVHMTLTLSMVRGGQGHLKREMRGSRVHSALSNTEQAQEKVSRHTLKGYI